MEFTEYKYDPEKIRKRVVEMTGNLVRNQGRDDLLQFGAGVIHERVTTRRTGYLEYGPYWWALKRVMQRCGYFVGKNDDDPVLAEEYCGDSDVETMVMADTFADYYISHFFVGTRDFVLNSETGQVWTLMDTDMEQFWSCIPEYF